jgi:aryl-alcohol dehydrogenase-like predicted oxidoreductase
MRYRHLGKSGLEVSEIGFGVMTFGGGGRWQKVGDLDQKQADELISLALDNGINFFDTADVYSSGLSETMLGKALGTRRRDAIIATKCGLPMAEEPNSDGLSRKRIIECCEASLKRLGTDYIDLYQIHSFDFLTPLEETLSTFNMLLQQGKVLYIGCSNFTGWQLMKAMAICEKNGWERFVSLQAYYSLVGRELELELVPACLDQGIGILPWSPLHGGFLSGKYSRDHWPENTRISSSEDLLPMNWDQGFSIVDELKEIARDRNVSIAQVALNYLLRKPGVTSIVIGARTKKQLMDNMRSSDWELSKEEVKRSDKLSEPVKIYPHWYFEIFRKGQLNKLGV